MHIRDQKKTQTIFMNIDLIINSRFIEPNKHNVKELHHMDLQETIVLRIKSEG